MNGKYLIVSLLGFWFTFSAGLARAETTITPQERVRNIYSAYKVDKTIQEVLDLVGSEDALVKALIAERSDTATPFVAIRSEQALLDFASRVDVLAILKADLLSPDTPGFAKTIASNLEHVADQAARRELAALSLKRAATDASFVPFARMLTFSSDPELQKLGAELPQVVQ